MSGTIARLKSRRCKTLAAVGKNKLLFAKMNSRILLIAGTDTEVGKTVLTTALMAYGQIYLRGEDWGLMKLMQTGSGDRELYQRLFGLEPESTTPLHFETPAAPPVAARLEGKTIALDRVWRSLQQLASQRDLTLVEALGGLGSPVTEELTVADLAAAWRLPTVLVVPVKLGAIAAAVANVALARQCGVALQGIVLSCVTPEAAENLDLWAPGDLISSLTQTVILGSLPYLDNPNEAGKLAAVASNLELEWLGIGYSR